MNSRWLKSLPLNRFVMDGSLLLICVALSFMAPNFFSLANFFNILQDVSMWGLIAFGMTMVIVAKEIDISVGSNAAFASCLVAWLVAHAAPIPVAVVVTVGCGFCIGLVTGFLRVHFEVPSFISTLALYAALKGMALMIAGGLTLMPFPEWYAFLGRGRLYDVPFPALVLIVAFGAFYFVMQHSPFGAAVYAVGGNDEAARLSGINVSAVRYLVFAITGAMAALSGVLLSSRMMSGSPTAVGEWELDAITAVIIGGASFAGGVGSIRGTLIGLIFISVVNNGMTLMNVQAYYQYVVRGGLILAAVLVNSAKGRLP